MTYMFCNLIDQKSNSPEPLNSSTEVPIGFLRGFWFNFRICFCITHAGAEYVYYISVDEHILYVVASDGYEIAPIEATHIIIQPGETMDFEMQANQGML